MIVFFRNIFLNDSDVDLVIFRLLFSKPVLNAVLGVGAAGLSGFGKFHHGFGQCLFFFFNLLFQSLCFPFV